MKNLANRRPQPGGNGGRRNRNDGRKKFGRSGVKKEANSRAKPVKERLTAEHLKNMQDKQEVVSKPKPEVMVISTLNMEQSYLRDDRQRKRRADAHDDKLDDGKDKDNKDGEDAQAQELVIKVEPGTEEDMDKNSDQRAELHTEGTILDYKEEEDLSHITGEMLPVYRNSLAEEVKKIRTSKASDRKNCKRLSEANKKAYLEMQEKKQVSRSLLPDAPERKQKRKKSPARIACPLLPGVPVTPPPRKRQRWENTDQEERRCVSASPSSSRPSRFSLKDVPDGNDPVPVTPPRKMPKLMFSPATSILRGETVNLENVELVNAQIEIIGFTPDASIFDETGEIEWDETIETNPGSDIDEDVMESEDPTCITQTAGNLPPDMEDLLLKMDERDDYALRDIVSDPDMFYFNWSSDPDTFTGKQEKFTGEAGPTFSVKDLSPFDVLQKIWDDSIMELIVRETNRYGQQLMMRARKVWSDVNIADIWVFLAIIMLQSIVPLPVEKEYWYPCLAYLQVGDFTRLMSYKKFLLIKKCLHFVDNTVLAQVTGENKKLQKIWPIIEHLNNKFSSLYLPEQHIAIDESLLLWKGRLSFVQLIATKAARVGIKSYELCESRTGYLWKMLIYTGKRDHDKPDQDTSSTDEPTGATSKIVYDLVRPLLNRGHTLVMDNFYNSPLLSRTLKNKKTDTMGTVRLNRQFIPGTLSKKTKNNTRSGEILFSVTEDLSVCVWHDKNIVAMLSTYHKPVVGGKEKFGTYKYKPQVVLDYNLSMGGVDKKDQMLQAFPVERIRNLLWYKKLFRRLLNVSIYNSFIIYNTKNQRTNQRQFRISLADEILRKMIPAGPPCKPINSSKGHYPAKNKSGRSRCQWCSKRKIVSRTAWQCGSCAINLCLIGCFKEYHEAL